MPYLEPYSSRGKTPAKDAFAYIVTLTPDYVWVFCVLEGESSVWNPDAVWCDGLYEMGDDSHVFYSMADAAEFRRAAKALLYLENPALTKGTDNE
jgi:hypothetical protein